MLLIIHIYHLLGLAYLSTWRMHLESALRSNGFIRISFWRIRTFLVLNTLTNMEEECVKEFIKPFHRADESWTLQGIALLGKSLKIFKFISLSGSDARSKANAIVRITRSQSCIHDETKPAAVIRINAILRKETVIGYQNLCQ